MKKGQYYDEKQLQDRGKVYQISFFVAILVFFALYLITGIAEISISELSRILIGMWVPITVCLILMISKNAYEGVGSKVGGITTSVLGAGGIYSIVTTVIKMMREHTGFWSDSMINDYVGWFVMGSCMIAVCAAYWIRYGINKKKFEE